MLNGTSLLWIHYRKDICQMKQLIALLLALMTLLSLALSACDTPGDTSSSAESSAELSAESSENTSSDDTSSATSEIVEAIVPEFCTVISTGASYTTDTEAGSSYTDSYGKELTDGQFAPKAGASYSDEKFSGYSTGGKALAVTLDLGELTEKIYRFEVNYLNTNSAGIAAPGGITVQISADGEEWTRVGSLKKPEGAELETTQAAFYEHSAYLSARYVRFNIAPGSAWIFLDEVQVCADVEGENMNEQYLQQLSSRYEEDTVTSAERTGMLASVRGDEVDRSLTCNLISINRPYKTSVESLADYKDSGTMLTDGMESHYFEGGTWVGFDAAQDVSVVVDLGSVRTDLAEFTSSVFVNVKIGLLAPLDITVFVSEDNASFTEIGKIYGPSDTTQTDVIYRLSLSRAVKGRYVRFDFKSADGSYFLVEECGVYAYGEEETGLVLYPDVVLPKADGSYWSSSESDYIMVQNLILGKQQQIMSCDTATAEMIENNTPVTSTLLTDGQYAPASQNNIHSGIFFKFSNGGSRDIIYDIGHLSEVRGTKVSFLSYTDWAVRLPDAICVYLSEDGNDWYEVCEISTVTEQDNKAVQFEVTFDMPYIARYVSFSFDVKAWSAADELELIGTKKVSSNAQSLASSGLHSIRLVPNGYQQQDSTLLNGAGDIVLMYHGQNYNNTEESTLPYVAYLDEEGNIKDTMFDGFLYLLTGNFPSGKSNHEGTVMTDWTWYLDDLFAEGENLDALNKTAAKVNSALNLDKKYNFYVAMYRPHNSVTSFGDVDGDGVSECFFNKEDPQKAMEDRFKAIEWYMTEFYARLAQANYDNLSFGGFYWYDESISTYDDPMMYDLVRGIADRVHARGTQFFWIPYFTAAGYSRWASFGFDVACYQPNYAFNGNVLEPRLKEAAAMMRKFGLCTELEISEDALGNDVFYDKYMNYLKYGITEGYMKEALHMYYQGTNIFGIAAVSSNAKIRLIYDYTYQFIKETLKYAPEAREAISFTGKADTPYTGTLAPDGEKAIKYRVAISAEHGSITINEDGTFVYYPNKGFTGTDTFSYAISEQLGYSDPCEVTIVIE